MLPRCHYFCWCRKLCRSTAKHGGSAAKHEGGAVSASKCFHQGLLCSMPTIHRFFCRTQCIHGLQHAHYHALPLCLLLLGCSLPVLLGCGFAAAWLLVGCLLAAAGLAAAGLLLLLLGCCCWAVAGLCCLHLATLCSVYLKT